MNRGEQTIQTPHVYQIVLVKDEDGRVVVTCPELPGVVTDGINEREAKKNARHAISDMLNSLGRSNELFNISTLS